MSKHNPEAIFNFVGASDFVDAYSVTVAALIDDHGAISTTLGLASGQFMRDIAGEAGFGWDNQFVPTGHDKTYAEMGDEKHLISSRASAAVQLLRN